MKIITFTLLCILLNTLTLAHAREAKVPDIIESTKPFAICTPASRHAQQTLEQVTQQLNYQGDAITLCRSISIPTLAAWSKLLRMEQHPYVNWKKLPVTKPYISYNPLYLELLETAQGTAVVYALLARQVGHHIKAHTDYQTPLTGLDPSPAQMVEADYFAGFMLAKQGLTSRQLAEAQQIIFNLTEYPEATRLSQRQQQLLQGWHNGGGPSTTLADIKITQQW